MPGFVIPVSRVRVGRAGSAWALGLLCAVLLSSPHRSTPLRDAGGADVSLREQILEEAAPLLSLFSESAVEPEPASPLPARATESGSSPSRMPDYRFESVMVEHNFVSAVQRVGVSGAVAAMLVSAFAHEIDFRRDLKRGHSIKFIFPRPPDADAKPDGVDASAADAGDALLPLAVRIERGARKHDVFLFRDGDGNASYRPKRGLAGAPRKSRHPVAFQRISSHFSPRRLHPVTLQWRAHEGVDFVAPAGTPVYAPIDGKVAFAGKQTGYGNVVKLSHVRGYSTVYAHLASFASGLRVGGSVREGDLLGYVGSTGWSTGPHLHYEVRVNGLPRDPLKVELPRAAPDVPISTTEAEIFQKETTRLSALF